MEQQRRFYPIGIQTFSELRNKPYLYIDKTEHVYRITHSDSKYVFLSRPRVSASHCSPVLQPIRRQERTVQRHGHRKRKRKWTGNIPCCHFDMSMGKHLDKEGLERFAREEYFYEKVERGCFYYQGQINESTNQIDYFSA